MFFSLLGEFNTKSRETALFWSQEKMFQVLVPNARKPRPQSQVLLEKAIGAQIVMRFRDFYGT
jgi:hypothetical protein